LIDGQTLFRRALIALLAQDSRFVVVGEATTAEEGRRRAAELKPDLILLESRLPDLSGIHALHQLKEISPTTRVLMLTASETEHDLVAALTGGAQGYLLKNIDSDALALAIERAMCGDAVVSPALTSTLVEALQHALQLHSGGGALAGAPAEFETIATLSLREHEVMRLVASGQSNKFIARELNIAVNTVKIHLHHILRKLGVTSRTQAAVAVNRRH
jgi:two-component system, NarL family, nitrate/nitrite response regulator NarL